MQFSLRGLLIGISVVALIVVVLKPLLVIFPPFYYAEYRAVEKRLGQIPNLEIESTWIHKDITLEDCGFVVKSESSPAVNLCFYDNQDWIELFNEIQGIVFRDPNSRTQELWASRQQMRAAGLKIDGLTDVLHNLDEVLEFCEQQEFEPFQNHPSRFYPDWAYLGYPRK